MTPEPARAEQLCFEDYELALIDETLERGWPQVPNARVPLDLQLHKPVRTVRVKEGVL